MEYIDVKATVVPSPDRESVLCCGREYPYSGSLAEHFLDYHSSVRHFHPEGKPDLPLFLEAPRV